MIQQDRPAAAPTLPARAPGSPATRFHGFRGQRASASPSSSCSTLGTGSTPSWWGSSDKPARAGRPSRSPGEPNGSRPLTHTRPRRRARSHPRLDVVSALPGIEFDENVVQTFCHFDTSSPPLAAAGRQRQFSRPAGGPQLTEWCGPRITASTPLYRRFAWSLAADGGGWLGM
jgi:hypothetical protein